MLARLWPRCERIFADRKRELLGPLRGLVLEIGPGAGVNLGYYGPGVWWIGAEPDPLAYRHLRERRPDARIVRARAERLPFADGSVDAVVCTHVLCSVADPAACLAEVARVLRPGGRFVFLEHVAAPEGTLGHRVQRAVRPLWRLVMGGCCPDRPTDRLIRAARVFAVEWDSFRVPWPVVGPHVAGRAVRQVGPAPQTGVTPTPG